ncbi:ATP-binding protein [Roseomonas marmotae]|uniref:ATP-binding protein n=1 Tax=Roseomonas marmotae TaxID=2768161 RepID=A0ABS3K765_9PROT|nr:ATP-binding protein [Roseomonas marmotae]MBO1073301.1 ATP-binding protein [Roseomonas marmotae]QTI79081.1 ATP-binding protein [Roseomonas marmotae]
MPEALELRLPPTPEAVGELMDRLEAWAEEAELPPRLTSHLMLVCEELAANIAGHGAAAGAGFMAFSLRQDGEGLRVVIEDDGPEFDPLSAPVPDTAAPMDDREPGGLGLHLVRRLASTVCYARADGRNRVSLTLGAPG